MSGVTAQGSFFNTLSDREELDTEKFLTEVDAQFNSPEIMGEVRWRLDVLREIASRPELTDVSDGLRDRLTQIFSQGGDEAAVLERLRALTEIEREDGEKLDLRRFVQRERRTLTSQEYRAALARKVENTNLQVVSLSAYYPDAQAELSRLRDAMQHLLDRINDPRENAQSVKEAEDELRGTPTFAFYEDLKNRFLRDWLARFADLSEEDAANLSPSEVQRLIVEHQRHQMTELLKVKVKLSDTDMTQHLGLHDTLEGEFRDKDFWEGATVNVRKGFREWILAVVQAFGMLKGQRHAFFQSQQHPEQYLLFGLGLADMPSGTDEPISLVPYVKPFTRKTNYLLEVRQRELSDPDEYYQELRHYVLPFLFAFDQMKNFKVSPDLISFFTSKD